MRTCSSPRRYGGIVRGYRSENQHRNPKVKWTVIIFRSLDVVLRVSVFKCDFLGRYIDNVHIDKVTTLQLQRTSEAKNQRKPHVPWVKYSSIAHVVTANSPSMRKRCTKIPRCKGFNLFYIRFQARRGKQTIPVWHQPQVTRLGRIHPDIPFWHIFGYTIRTPETLLHALTYCL